MSGYVAPNRLLLPMRHSIDTLTGSWLPQSNAATSAGAFTQNRAYYVPIGVASTVVVSRLWCHGSTGTGGTVDMGLYDRGGVQVVAATAITKTTYRMELDVTDTVIAPGLYYIAVASNSATDTFFRLAVSASTPVAYGVRVEDTAYPLPSTATWSLDQALNFVPLLGMMLGPI